jgi:hypothetical protein
VGCPDLTILQLARQVGVIASSSRIVMAVRSGDHHQRRHEGYLRIDLLATSLRSNREVDVFVLQTARQEFFHARPSTKRCSTKFAMSGCICMHPRRMCSKTIRLPAGLAFAHVHFVFNTCTSSGRIDLQIIYMNREVIMNFNTTTTTSATHTS